MKKIYLALLFTALSTAFSLSCTTSWTKDGDGQWTDGGNWSDGVPTQPGTVIFPPHTSATIDVDLDGTTAANEFIFNQAGANGMPSYTISGAGSVRPDSLITLTDQANGSAYSVTISSIFTTIVGTGINTGSNTLTLSGIMTGSTDLAKSGTGVLELTNLNNTFSGNVTVNEGSFKLGGDGEIAAGTNFNLAGSAATLDLSTVTGIRNLGEINGVAGTSFLLGTHSHRSTCNTDATCASTISSTNEGGGIIKAGTATWTLSGQSTYSGKTEIEGGTLSISEDANLGASTGQLGFNNGATLLITSSTDFSLNRSASFSPAGGTFNIQNADTTITLSAGTTLTGGFTKAGAGTLVLAANNQHSGTITINAGTLSVSNDGNLGQADSALTFSGGSLKVTGTTSFDTSNRTTTVNAAGGTFDIDDSSMDFGLAGQLTGTGAITKTGEGTLSLKNTGNNQSGAITVTAGAVSISQAANLSTSTLTLNGGKFKVTGDTNFTLNNTITASTSGAEIDIDQAAMQFTLQAQLTGAGATTKSGSGELVLANATNNFSGQLTIGAGTVSYSDPGALSTTSISFDGGTLKNTLALTLPATKTVTMSGAGTIQTDADLTLNSLLAGTGNLTKTGTGTLTVGNTGNTHSGTIIVSAGTLKGSVETLPENIENDGTLDFEQNDTATYQGTLSGTGNVQKTGTGNLILTGTHTIAGTFTIAAGTLTAPTQAFTNTTDITNNSALVINQVADGTYSSTLTGAGTLQVTGSAIATLSGNSSATYTGNTTITSGTLSVNGNLGTGTVTVASAGTLMGTGTVGPVTNQGNFAPGNSIGTTIVTNTYVQTATGTLTNEVNAQDQSDLVSVVGAPATAQLAGTLALVALPGNYNARRTYTILTAPGGVTGTFTTVTTNIPRLFRAPQYNATSVTITTGSFIERIPVPVASLIGNPKRIAEYYFGYDWEPLPSSDLVAFIHLLAALPADRFRYGLLQLGPQQYGALPLANLQNDIKMADSFSNMIEPPFGCFDGCAGQEDAKDARSMSIWARPLILYYNQNPTQNQWGFDVYTYGSAAGYTFEVRDAWRVNLGGGYTYSNLYWKGNQGNSKYDTLYLSPSVGYYHSKYYWNCLLLSNINFYRTKRKIHYTGLSREANSRHRGYDILIRLEGGAVYKIKKPGLCLLPQVQVNLLNFFQDNLLETGAKDGNLKVQHKLTTYVRPDAKVNLYKIFKRPNFCIIPNIYMGWLMDIPLTSGRIYARLAGNNRPSGARHFNVVTYYRAITQMSYGASVSMTKENKTLFSFSYNTNTFNKAQTYDWKVELCFDF